MFVTKAGLAHPATEVRERFDYMGESIRLLSRLKRREDL